MNVPTVERGVSGTGEPFEGLLAGHPVVEISMEGEITVAPAVSLGTRAAATNNLLKPEPKTS